MIPFILDEMIFFSMIVFCFLAIAHSAPEVSISDGKLKGSVLRSKEGKDFYAFQGIPFAEPPTGDLRFKSPIAKIPWDGVLETIEPHVFCPQRDIFSRKTSIEGNEDCLYLNVYTPTLNTGNNKSLLPVMVFIHGGGYLSGGGSSKLYGPEVLLEKEIVLVVPNYRLGALGFLSTGDEASPGNYGLKDQSLALKWVKRNIKYFGGDPNSVTIFGQSAGAASVHFHMMSPLSKGMFNRVISQSATALCRLASSPKEISVKNAKKLAESVGCPTESSGDLVDCLRKVDVETIISKDRIFTEWDSYPLMPFRPTVEAISDEAFLIDDPENLMNAGKFEDVPWMVGLTTEDGLMGAASFSGIPKLYEEFNEDMNKKIALVLGYNGKFENQNRISEAIRKFYFGSVENLNKENSFTGLINMFTDAIFTKPIDDVAKIHLKISKQPLYIYLFGYKSGTSYSQVYGDPNGDIHGVCHGDELQYLFPTEPLFPNRNVTIDDLKMTKMMTTLWVNFAKTGNPTPETNDIIRSKWIPTKSDKLEYYHIDVSSQMKEALFEERINFWRNLPMEQKKFDQKEEL